ncbi:MAG: outer membrane lipoprotein-sorting protein [Pseudomonadota bacterium]
MKGKKLMVRAVICTAIVFMVAWLGSAPAEEKAKLTAAKILDKCDDFHFFAKDMEIHIDVTVKDKEGKEDYHKLIMFQKGKDKRLLRWTEPADLADFAVLNKDANTMYVYEPSLGKVRRIASHAKKQTMLGYDYTLDESSIFRLANEYDPAIESEDDKQVNLKLTQKPGKDLAWPILNVVVNKKYFNADKIEYRDKDGKKHKTETRTGVKKWDGHNYCSMSVMKDHGKSHSTTYKYTDVRFNRGLDDDLFSKRALVRDE